MKIVNGKHLLLVQIKNDTTLFASGIVNQDFRQYRINLLEKYPQMKDFLLEEFFDFDKIWSKWLNLLSWSKVENNMSLEFIAAHLKTKTTVMNGTVNPEKLLIELNGAKNNNTPYTHVGFGIYPVGYLQFIECARIAKEFDPQIITVAGNIGGLIDETKNHVDKVLLGDGVKSLRQLLGETVNDPYKVSFSTNQQSAYSRTQMVNLVTKLGCPGNCSFCMTPKLFDNKITPPFVTPRQVYDAIININGKTEKSLAINVCEPNMLLFRQWWYELFELFEGYKDPISIGGAATLKSIQKFDFKRIANSSLNFSLFNIGIESFTEHFDKNTEYEEVKEIINKLRNIGIGTLATFIVGFEHHTRESVLEEIRLLSKLDCLFYLVQNLKAYPGTDFWDKLKREKKLISGIPYDFYYITGFQAFKHKNFNLGFEDMLPLIRDIYFEILRESGPEVLNCVKLYENKQTTFDHFTDSASDCRILSKKLFRSWKKALNPSEKQIENYLKKLE